METIIDGLQGDGRAAWQDTTSVLATAKHFVGDGGTDVRLVDDRRATRSTRASRRHDRPQSTSSTWRRSGDAVQQHGVGSVMPSYSSVDWTRTGRQPDQDARQRSDLITGVLKEQDRLRRLRDQRLAGHRPDRPGDYATDVRTAVNAGIDMVMVPDDYEDFEHDADRRGQRRPMSPMARIDDAVTPDPHPEVRARPVRAAVRRPHQQPTDRLAPPTGGGPPGGGRVAGAAEERRRRRCRSRGRANDLRRRLQRRRPRQPDRRLDHHLAGRVGQPRSPARRSSQGMQADAATRTVTYSARTPRRRRRGYDVGVVVVGETPYAEGIGDIGANGPRPCDLHLRRPTRPPSTRCARR